MTTSTEEPPDLLLPQAMVRIADLVPHPQNPRIHDQATLKASVEGFSKRGVPQGIYKPIVVNKPTNMILAGHGTVEAAVQNKVAWVQVSYVDVDQETADRILAIDNRSSDLATYDPRLLVEFLSALPDLDYTGYNQDALDELIREIELDDPDPGDIEDDPDAETPPTPNDSMALAGVVVGDPEIQTHKGDVWRLGEHHHLVVADVHSDHQLYTPLLTPDALFWPYPTLLAPFASNAVGRPVVMVQPNLYLAGWLLTKWKRVTGVDPERVSA